ncbi:MAG: hypothetical protein K0Q49_444 [Haloplasmataceae bacterium]|jgi:tetratricopeptide (TPR) repeat protein|nr:hypothetical protein [Haloplasmataceae bacterium]
MGVSFKKSFRLSKNTRINLSKDGGIGFSTGFKGFRISKNNEGTRITIGKDGVYYSKFFGKKKKKDNNKDKNITEIVKDINQTNADEAVEQLINPETDYEAIPTEEEEILLYMGSKTRDYLLYLYFSFVVISAVIYFIKTELLFGIILGLLILVTLFHIFVSKRNNFINDLNRSIKYFDQGYFEKCYYLLDRCLETLPKNKKALLLMIFTAFRMEKYAEALTFIDEYKKENDLFEVIYFIEGVSLTETGKYQEGINAIEHVYSEEEEIKFAKYKLLGDCFLGLGDLNKAILWYEKLPVKSKTMDDNIASYKYAYGKALYLSGNHKKAFVYLSSVYDYKPNFKDVKDLIHAKIEETVI